MKAADPGHSGFVAPLILLAALPGISCDAPAAPAPTVRFEVDAPLCSGVHFPLRFSIDGVVVGQDTLVHGASSDPYLTTSGAHDLLAEFLTAPTQRDTTVTLGAGERFRMVLDFYCS